MAKFLGYTIGLECATARGPKMCKIEYQAGRDGQIKLVAVSGHNLSALNGIKQAVISREAYEDRPADDVAQAIWAFEQVGLRPVGL